MLTLTAVLPIDLDILDNQNVAVARLTATLRDLQGEWAALVISEQPGVTCLHWGTQVRFFVPNGTNLYEVNGTVVEQKPIQIGEMPADESQRTPVEREMIVRLSECRTLPQRRVMPRRLARFAVQYRLLTLGQPEQEVAATYDASMSDTNSDAADNNDVWLSGWVIDIGAGGMRMRTDRRDSWPRQIALLFNLPLRSAKVALATDAPAPQPFRLTGRVLRIAPVRSRTGGADLVVAFENLSVQDGMRLTAFLCGPL